MPSFLANQTSLFINQRLPLPPSSFLLPFRRALMNYLSSASYLIVYSHSCLSTRTCDYLPLHTDLMLIMMDKYILISPTRTLYSALR